MMERARDAEKMNTMKKQTYYISTQSDSHTTLKVRTNNNNRIYVFTTC